MEKGIEKKTEMASLDIMFLVREIRPLLAGGFIRKIYQYGKSRSRQFLFEIFTPGKEAFWLYFDSGSMFITTYKRPAMQEPPNFCMFLRKHMMGKRIRDIRQHEFDRIVEISTDENVLIVELFSAGNVILCSSSYTIIMPLEIQKWKDREIKPKQPYRYPPRQHNIMTMPFDEFCTVFKRSGKNIISVLASDLGLGPVYAKEFCHLAGIDGRIPAAEIRMEQAATLHKAIAAALRNYRPTAYGRFFVAPFPIKSAKELRDEKSFETLSAALDEFFSEQQIEVHEEEHIQKEEEIKQKFERIERQKTDAKEKWQRIDKDSRESAEAIYRNYTTVEGVLAGIQKAKDSGLSWDEIKQRVQSEDSPEAAAIKEIREKDGIVVMELDGRDVEIDIRYSVEENAARYYEDAKWAKRKYTRVDESAELHEKKMKMELEGVVKERAEAEKKAPRKRKRWHEKFRWFLSSEGFLVVGGKSADQNEMIMKKYAQDSDPVFHADIHGAAFVVVQSKGEKVPEQTLREAAEFAAASCKAWGKGLGTVDIYSVPRRQASKSPPSGEALGKGAFMIYGERAWYRNTEIKLAIGVSVDRETHTAGLMAGPVMAIRKNMNYFVTVRPGLTRSLELAREIKNKILVKARPEDKPLIEKIPVDEIQALIPSGMGEVVEK